MCKNIFVLKYKPELQKFSVNTFLKNKIFLLKLSKNLFLLKITMHSYKSLMLKDFFNTLYFPNLNCQKMGLKYQAELQKSKANRFL